MQHGRRVMALIGGAFKEDPPGSGNFRTMRIDETDFGIIGDSLRGEATAALYHQHRTSTTVLVVGGVTPLHKTKPDAPHLSSVIKQELVALRNPVPAEVIQELDMDPDAGTYKQLVHLQSAVNQQPQIEAVLVVTNRWQMARIEAMIRFRDELAQLNDARVRLVGAEDVLLDEQPSLWVEPITLAYRSQPMRETLKRELNGAKMIADGTYYQLPTTSPNR